MNTATLYQPSNGSEGEWFINEHCMNCIHCDPDPHGDKQCSILCATMCYSVNDPEYPKEWVYKDNGEPTCTKWSKWNWEKQGNPDDPENINAPIAVGENQLSIPF